MQKSIVSAALVVLVAASVPSGQARAQALPGWKIADCQVGQVLQLRATGVGGCSPTSYSAQPAPGYPPNAMSCMTATHIINGRAGSFA